jgi:HK97 gp10 family phage protein
MSHEFGSLGAFAEHLIVREIATLEALHAGLEKVAWLIEGTAKAEIGTYQPEAGPFPAWADLADATEAEKARLGFPVDAPLLRTGEMRESITHQVAGLEAAIGSNEDKMIYHEFGTSRIPPRPVLGPAAFRNKEKIRAIIGEAVVTGLIGGSPIHPSLGYDFPIK